MRPAGEAHQPSASSDISEGLWSRTAADPTDSASGGGKKSHTLAIGGCGDVAGLEGVHHSQATIVARLLRVHVVLDLVLQQVGSIHSIIVPAEAFLLCITQ